MYQLPKFILSIGAGVLLKVNKSVYIYIYYIYIIYIYYIYICIIYIYIYSLTEAAAWYSISNFFLHVLNHALKDL